MNTKASVVILPKEKGSGGNETTARRAYSIRSRNEPEALLKERLS
jgi:hypothetical protein